MILTEALGLAGGLIGVASYGPQILHVLKKKCVHGLSLTAWGGWLLSTALIIPHAFVVGDPLFIFLQVLGLASILVMVALAYMYRGKYCGECKK